MAGKPIKVVNDTDTKLLVSAFKAGDSGIPFDATWINAKGNGELKVGDFASLGVGVQTQEGGRWVGDDPKNPPFGTPGQTCTISVSKVFS